MSKLFQNNLTSKLNFILVLASTLFNFVLMKKIILVLFLQILILKSVSALKLSNDAQVSLITCSAGNEGYTSFGHSAIRLVDDSNYVDWVFNYGTFDFDQPNFYQNFVKGRLLYFLSVEHFVRFKSVYIQENRSIKEQILNLDKAQKQLVADYLMVNAEPENREYLYEFLYNNCSSILVDVIENALNTHIVFDTIVADTTFRELIDYYMAEAEWSDFGIDLLLGKPVDIEAGYKGRMFLPNELSKAFSKATLNGQPLAPQVTTLYEGTIKRYKEDFILTPQALFWILLFVALILKLYYPDRIISQIIPFIFIFLSGIIGVILVLMWAFTDHITSVWNLNLLWALPFNIIMVFPLFIKQNIRRANKYWKIVRLIWILFLFASPIIPQSFHAATLPFLLICILGVSSIVNLDINKKKIGDIINS